jgi:hypothetical protein
MRSGYFLIALVLAVNGAGCAQVKKVVNRERLTGLPFESPRSSSLKGF